jgi:hypothetical protein
MEVLSSKKAYSKFKKDASRMGEQGQGVFWGRRFARLIKAARCACASLDDCLCQKTALKQEYGSAGDI